MCDTRQLVPIPEHLKPFVDFDAGHSEFGIDGDGQQCFNMDACIVPQLLALWSVGTITMRCCCGHGSGKGVISIVTGKG